MLVAFAYSTRESREKSTKTDSVKHILVHPTLAAMLAEWKLGEWAAMNGRHPEPDELIVPLPPEAAARRRTRAGDPYRGHDYSGDRWRLEDLPALRWRHHARFRRWRRSTPYRDPRDPHEEGAFRVRRYNRGRKWELTCAEVAKLKVARRPVGQGEATALPVAVGAEGAERAEAADGDASRYSARYSARKAEGSHAKKIALW